VEPRSPGSRSTLGRTGLITMQLQSLRLGQPPEWGRPNCQFFDRHSLLAPGNMETEKAWDETATRVWRERAPTYRVWGNRALFRTASSAATPDLVKRNTFRLRAARPKRRAFHCNSCPIAHLITPDTYHARRRTWCRSIIRWMEQVPCQIFLACRRSGSRLATPPPPQFARAPCPCQD